MEQRMGRGVLRNPYKGLEAMRYQFLLDNMPQEVKRIEAEGPDSMQRYLTDCRHRYDRRYSEIMMQWQQKPKNKELMQRDLQTWTQEYEWMKISAAEIARSEVIEAL